MPSPSDIEPEILFPTPESTPDPVLKEILSQPKNQFSQPEIDPFRFDESPDLLELPNSPVQNPFIQPLSMQNLLNQDPLDQSQDMDKHPNFPYDDSETETEDPK